MAFPTTWLLLEDRASHRSQIIGVAEKLGWPVIAKEIHYNKTAALANRFTGARLWHLTKKSKATITEPWPDLVIAVGRRAALISLAIKKRSPHTKLVHFMWPDIAPGKFDLIVVPEHDGKRKGDNIRYSFGSPHRFTPQAIMSEAARWSSAVARLPRPRIAVLVGGSDKRAVYEDADFKMLAAYASAEAERLDGSLMITSSPRTGEHGETLMTKLLTAPHVFNRWKAGMDNPYAAFLGLADAIIVTSDSVSMCSEACATGKPVYLFTPPHLSHGKKNFRSLLFERGCAKPHTYPIRLDWQPAAFPDSTAEVAQAIKNLFGFV